VIRCSSHDQRRHGEANDRMGALLRWPPVFWRLFVERDNPFVTGHINHNGGTGHHRHHHPFSLAKNARQDVTTPSPVRTPKVGGS